jgi:hypothetical protein
VFHMWGALLAVSPGLMKKVNLTFITLDSIIQCLSLGHQLCFSGLKNGTSTVENIRLLENAECNLV